MNRHSQLLAGLLLTLVLTFPLRVTAARSQSTTQQDPEEAILALPVLQASDGKNTRDYLIDASGYKARVGRSADGRTLYMDNGLIRRSWRVAPNGACVGFENLINGQSMLRSVRPEARITINGTPHEVGGLVGQPDHAFITPEWLDAMKAQQSSMRLESFEVDQPESRFEWKRRRHAAPDAVWPPRGVRLRMDYMPHNLEGAMHEARVSVYYELYDGIPAMSKWITVQNLGKHPLMIDRFTSEELALVEHANWVESREGVTIPRPQYLHVETDFAFGGFNFQNANRHVVHWKKDPLYSSQVNYARQTPCLLVCEPSFGPAQEVGPGETFLGFRVFELAYDDTDRERCGLALRRMYRTVAPWVTENPITHHLLSHDPERVTQAIDEAAEVGFEAIILSFGSGFHMGNKDPTFLARWKTVADHAEARGIELGSYSLFSSRKVEDTSMIVSPPGQTATHGRCPAVSSPWGLDWLKTIRAFYDTTGFEQFENDGPYPGDIDITSRPPLQKGINDSRWVQWQLTTGLYQDLRKRGVYINAPDYYYLNGSNKCGMGYREVNWSLPRAHQVIHTRQNIYDGSWTKTPSMGWMFVPLTQYHGGGAAATIEPLHAHLDHYESMMRSNLGMGVQAHYRGPRLFDTKTTRERVKEVVGWFKRHRDILESDIVHGRRADGRDLDWILHVNPSLKNRGMLCVYNPLNHEVTKTIRLNLYYTGITDTAQINLAGQAAKTYTLARDHHIKLQVTVPPQGMSWHVIR
ncbi:MAG: alpha-galactosidase [Verrucomicrobiota bacterium]|nr:alpha-galactosidase [Verrucomicrobiota bacterium]